MYDEPAGSDSCAGVDVKVVFPDDGIIRIESTRLFADADGSPCRRFVGRVFLATEIESVVIVSAMAERVTPAIEPGSDMLQTMSRLIYSGSYALAYGIVYAAVFVAQSLPQDNPVMHGLHDGGGAAMDELSRS